MNDEFLFLYWLMSFIVIIYALKMRLGSFSLLISLLLSLVVGGDNGLILFSYLLFGLSSNLFGQQRILARIHCLVT